LQIQELKLTIIVAGGLAFDEIWSVDAPRPNSHSGDISTWSFTATSRTIENGGCAGNVAAALARLRCSVSIVASTGSDFDSYKEELISLGVDISQVRQVSDTLTARACMAQFSDQQHLTIFLLGAAGLSHVHPCHVSPSATLGVVLPETANAMCRRLTEFAQAKLHVVFAPGQAVTQLRPEHLPLIYQGCMAIILNTVEWQALKQIMKVSCHDFMDHGIICFETSGGNGSILRISDTQIDYIPPVDVKSVIDPTGCGDAYTAGVCAELGAGGSPHNAARLGSLLASINLRYIGCQTYLNYFDLEHLRSFSRQQYDTIPSSIS
jgi:adenosine kinase